MLLTRRSPRAAALALAAAGLALSPAALAHETKSVAKFRLTIGWGEEPVFSGAKNSVEVDVADAAGAPVTRLDGSLSAEVSFGDERVTLPLAPSRERPGRYHAFLVPTRPGTYTFHITGTVKGQPIDMRSTCSDATFDCVTDIAELQFPAKDPSAGQLAESVGRALPRAERAEASASAARSVAIAAIALAVVALVAAIGARRGRKAA
jgi:hypothetical protein